MSVKAEYIWIDGTEPTARLRSKTKIMADGADLPIWGFDGSSTNQAPGKNSDCVLKPVFSCPDPLRGDPHQLVMCEVLLTDMTPHATNTRALIFNVKGEDLLFLDHDNVSLSDSDRDKYRELGLMPGAFKSRYCNIS